MAGSSASAAAAAGLTYTRAQRMREQSPDGELLPLPLPALSCGEYLVSYLMEAGPSLATGMGPAPLTWSEIEVWQRLTGTPLQPWEARMLRDLSRAWVLESRQAEKPDAPAPWVRVELTTDARTTLSRSIGAALSARARAPLAR